jgi:hypothetical protein
MAQRAPFIVAELGRDADPFDTDASEFHCNFISLAYPAKWKLAIRVHRSRFVS